jgi:hypothetical protein
MYTPDILGFYEYDSKLGTTFYNANFLESMELNQDLLPPKQDLKRQFSNFIIKFLRP